MDVRAQMAALSHDAQALDGKQFIYLLPDDFTAGSFVSR